ncbi:MAG: cell division protein FtsL [Selenomonadaceae bacterium]|nr:cell division protein FtsL [Selenomonadaceae bacterium]MBR3497808.1 cell division protein FtsL [Selenomonadaceae bacterium]
MRKRSGFNWFALVMFAMIAYFSTVLISQQVHLAHVSESQRIADKRLEKAKATNEKLRKELAALQDINNIEKLAREDLGLAKEGEMPYQATRN